MKSLKKLVLFIFVLVLVAAGGAGLAAFQFLNTPASSSTEKTTFEVPPGESFHTTARRLQEAGLVKSATFLRLYARVTGQGTRMRMGEYAMSFDMKPKQVLEIITSGKSIEHPVTVAEGLNIFEIAEIFAQARLCSADEALAIFRDKALVHDLLGEDHESLEGYLFPETYNITKYTGARGLTKLMVGRFNDVYTKLSALPNWNLAKLTRHELVTLASIVEKETGAPEERPVIASVFHNRLRQKMRLQTDPTVIYGIWEKQGKWDGKIGRAGLETPSRYNTYLIDGLPYGPVASPGQFAIRAAGLPATSEYLYFVSHLDGTHIFSKSYEQHQGAVSQFLTDRKKNANKSWRDLKNRKDAPGAVREASASASAGAKSGARAAVKAPIAAPRIRPKTKPPSQ